MKSVSSRRDVACYVLRCSQADPLCEQDVASYVSTNHSGRKLSYIFQSESAVAR